MVALSKSKTSRCTPTLRLVREDLAREDVVREDDTAPIGRIDGLGVHVGQSGQDAPLMRLGIDRRVFPRRHTEVAATGRRLDHSVAARRSPALALTVRDLSLGGLSAETAVPLAPGERIAVSFPRTGMQLGWDAFGRVVRCDATDAGYQIGVEFDLSPTAA